MENPPRRTDDGQKISFIPKLAQVFFNNGHSQYQYKIFGQGKDGSNRLVILCLGLLNAVLLIAAVVIAVNCAKVKEGSLHVSHSAAVQLIDELNYLRSNHSDVVEAEEEAKNELDRALKNHTQLKEKIEQLKTLNGDYQKQAEALRKERMSLRSNITALEGSCSRCLPKWIHLNSSCYFFSYVESSTRKKNWYDSRADCISRGADLIVIDNPEEQKFASDAIKNMRSGSNIWENGFWIGLTDLETEGTWVWVNNVTEVEQRYWMVGEPNNYGHRGGEDCVLIVNSYSNPWETHNDADCRKQRIHWICEMASS